MKRGRTGDGRHGGAEDGRINGDQKNGGAKGHKNQVKALAFWVLWCRVGGDLVGAIIRVGRGDGDLFVSDADGALWIRRWERVAR